MKWNARRVRPDLDGDVHLVIASASLFPARRATRVDPLEVLRAE